LRPELLSVNRRALEVGRGLIPQPK
jgi:hypothetical protein